MRKIDLIQENLETILEWKKLNAHLTRLGINPITSIQMLEIYKDVNLMVADEFNKTEAFEMLAKTKYKGYSSSTIKIAYYNACGKV